MGQKDRLQWTVHDGYDPREVLSPRRSCRPVLRKAGSRAEVKIKKNSRRRAQQAETQMRTAVDHPRSGKQMESPVKNQLGHR